MRLLVIARALSILAVGCTVCPQPASALATPSAGEAMRLVIELRPDQRAEDVETAMAYLSVKARVEPLFAGVDAPELQRMFVVTGIPRPLDTNPWDIAYRFKEAGGFAQVEPDRSDTLVPETSRQLSAQMCDMDGEGDDTDPAWALRATRADAAWAIAPKVGGRRFGEGVRICHPDTGWTDHPELDGAIDLTRAWNVMDDVADARDPLTGGFGLRSPGHGTSTGSVIASRGGVLDGDTSAPGRITGVAPLATLVPLRTVNHVVQVFDSDVAKAVVRSVASGCDVISMSLGGRGFFGLEKATRYAADRGLIIVAAAGNCVRLVVAPASYDDVVAVAATNAHDRAWSGSSRGPAVDISAPGENVWCAKRRVDTAPAEVFASNGTSYAAAQVAGAAALWVAFHGHPALEEAAGSKRIQELFVRLVRQTARPVVGLDPATFGPGILDAAALLTADIDSPTPPAAPAGDANAALLRLSRTIGRPPQTLRAALRALLDQPPDLDAEIARWEPELTDIALRDPQAFLLAVDDAASAPAKSPALAPARSRMDSLASESLRAALR